MQQFHMFGSENNEKDAHTGEVTGRPTETFNKAHLDWICPRHKDDRDRFWSLPLRQMRMGGRMPKSRPHYGSPISAAKGRQVIVVTICPAEFDTYVPPFDKAGFLQSFIESRQ